jgi:hypothetical protein
MTDLSDPNITLFLLVLNIFLLGSEINSLDAAPNLRRTFIANTSQLEFAKLLSKSFFSSHLVF